MFRCLNQEGQINSATDWNDSRRDVLWIYHLHYFDDLCARDAESRRAAQQQLIERWIVDNNVGEGIGWDPYPTSRRIVNWIKWALSGGHLSPAALDSLALQVRWLASRLEWHLRANHLFANITALIHAGAFFSGSEADSWLNRGADILDGQLDEQVLSDGGHYERSPMYHSIVLEHILDIINLDQAFPSLLSRVLATKLRDKAQLMLNWAQSMTHPDGGYAFFNDTVLDIAPTAGELQSFALAMGLELQNSTALKESGYVRLQRGEMVIMFDAADVGPDFQPGHAHADTLSFELSWGTQRVICNSGVSTYNVSQQRQWERSTAAHNSVELDAVDSSEVWSSFRVARRARPRAFMLHDTICRVSCEHDGYKRLRGSPIHRRTITARNNTLAWTDDISGTGEHKAVGRIPLHPSVRARRLSCLQWELTLPSGQVLLLDGDGTELGEEAGFYAPEFGMVLDRKVIVWTQRQALPISVSVILSALPQ